MIHAHPSAPLGSVTRLDFYTPQHFTPRSVVLCRNTAPLVRHAFALIRRGVPCALRGRDVGGQLCSIARKLKPADLNDLAKKLLQWRETQLADCETKRRSSERTNDLYACLIMFMQQVHTLNELYDKISSVFDDKRTGLCVLSTVHRAKGLEWPRVFILDFEKYMPSRYATQPWQITQETNLIYVAITRSMNELFYIESDKWQNIQT